MIDVSGRAFLIVGDGSTRGSIEDIVDDASLTQGADDTTVADFTSQQLALDYQAQLD